MEDSDIRFKILKRLRKENKGTAEFSANAFLKSLHKDLGTIKRALIDLLDDGYIKESNVDWSNARSKWEYSVISNMSSRGDESKKHSSRLTSEIGHIRIYLTLKGMQFLIESKNLARTAWMIKYDVPVKFAFIILGFSLAILGNYLNKMIDSNTLRNQEVEQSGNLPNTVVSSPYEDTTAKHPQTE